MYKTPSRRHKKQKVEKPNLIPILDAVFIFIFFLLMSTNFTKIFEIPSDVPILSNSTPPKKPPLALSLRISSSYLSVYSGTPSRLRRKFGKTSTGDYDLYSLHEYMIKIKQRNKKEKTIVFEPEVDIEYGKMVKIMDAVRILKNTDTAIYSKDNSGGDIRLKTIFNNIMFGNIRS